MILTFAEDFTSNVQLDSGLIGTSDSGLFYNKGVNPDVNITNILAFLPYVTHTYSAYSAGTPYGQFEVTGKRSDIVTYESKTYISLIESNKGHTPGASAYYWMETNIDSLRLRSFIKDCEQNLISALSLNKRFIENQYLYNYSEKQITLSGNYAGWCFSPKNSDYVKIVIKQIAIQAPVTTLVDLYVINQGVVKLATKLHPKNGQLVWEDLDYTIEGVGDFYFVIPSMDVYCGLPYNDPLKYKGFVAYPITGVGSTPEGSDYAKTFAGNGLNFNISVYTDPSTYITNNLIHLARLFQLQFEYDCIQMFVNNPYNQKNGSQANLNMSDYQRTLRVNELKNTEDFTIAKKYTNELISAKRALSNTFDGFLKVENDRFNIDEYTL